MGRSGAARALETAVWNFPMTALKGGLFKSRLKRRYNETPACEWKGTPPTSPHGSNRGQPLLPHLSKAAVLLLSKGRQAAQGGDGGVTTAAAGLSGGRLAVDAVVVPVQVVVTR